MKLIPEIFTRKALLNNPTVPEVERLIEMAYNRSREYFTTAGYPTWKDWWKADPQEVIDVISNDGDLYNAGAKFLEEDDTIATLLQAYQEGKLPSNRQPTVLGPATIGPERVPITKPEAWSPKKSDLSPEDAQALYASASTRMTNKNRAEVLNSRKDLLFAANTDKKLAEKIGISDKDLQAQIRSHSGLTASAIQMEDRLNTAVTSLGEMRELPAEYKWTGITNSSFLGQLQLDPDDMDDFFGKIHVSKEGEDSGYFSSPGRSLRYYISRVALAIDTRISYRDLEFDIGTFERHTVRGRYNPATRKSKKLIEVRADAQFSVAHEMGHYLDDKFGEEFGGGQYLTDAPQINSKNDYWRRRVSFPHLQWADKFHAFVDELATRSDIRSEYTQSRREIFARFISFFVTWTTRAAKREIGKEDQLTFRDQFSDLDCRNWVRLLQEKSYLDANVPMKRIGEAGIQAGIVSPEEFAEALAQAKQVDRRVRFLSDYSPEEYATMRLFLTPDGQAGFAIKQDGDIVNLFNVSPVRGLGRQLVDQAIANGGTHLDAFEGKLTDLYRSKGFEEVRRVPFDPQYAPEGWSEAEGTPDIVYMQRSQVSNPRAMMNFMGFSREAAMASPEDAKSAADLSGMTIEQIQGFRLDGPERIVGAVVITQDKAPPYAKRIWVDKHHGGAGEKAIAAGVVNDWDEMFFADAFITSYGNLIDRHQSKLQFDVYQSEEVYDDEVQTYRAPRTSKVAQGLEHYTTRKLVTVDPSFHGEGISGNERKRKANDPDNWVDRAYFYVEGSEPEAVFQGMQKYRADLPANAKIYDMANDPDGLSADCRTSIGYLNISCYEKKIKEAGYFGFQNTNSGVPNAIAVFYPVNVSPAQEVSAAETGEFDIHEPESIQNPYPSGQHLIGKYTRRANKKHDGFFVCLQLEKDTAEELAQDPSELMNEKAKDLHITLCYCEDVDELGQDKIDQAIDIIRGVAAENAPLEGKIGGWGRFTGGETSDGKEVIYATPDVTGLTALREELAERLTSIGVAPRGDHGYTPHITLAYVNAGEDYVPDLPEGLKLSFGEISIRAGEHKETVKLSGKPISPREAMRILTAEENSEDGIAPFQEKVRSEHPDVRLDLREDKRNKERKIVDLETIVVPKGQRGQGIGSEIMNKVIRWADSNGVTLTLSLADRNPEWGTTSANRLRKFYQQFGFVSNKGRKKDFSLSMYTDMYRLPKA